MDETKNQIRNRLKTYILQNYGSVYNLSQKTGIPQTTLNSVIGERQKSAPGSEILMKIKKADPFLDLNWLISGVKSKEIHSIGEAAEPMVPYYTIEQKTFMDLAKELMLGQKELIKALQDCIQSKNEKQTTP